MFALDQHYQHRAGSTQHKPGQTDKAAIDWCLAQKQSAGAHTATLNAAEAQYHHLSDELVLGIVLANPLASSAEHQLQALLTDIRAALARIDLNERLADSQLQAETDRMRAALLSSVSHDLKTPLATIMGPAAPCWNMVTGSAVKTAASCCTRCRTRRAACTAMCRTCWT